MESPTPSVIVNVGDPSVLAVEKPGGVLMLSAGVHLALFFRDVDDGDLAEKLRELANELEVSL